MPVCGVWSRESGSSYPSGGIPSGAGLAVPRCGKPRCGGRAGLCPRAIPAPSRKAGDADSLPLRGCRGLPEGFAGLGPRGMLGDSDTDGTKMTPELLRERGLAGSVLGGRGSPHSLHQGWRPRSLLSRHGGLFTSAQLPTPMYSIVSPKPGLESPCLCQGTQNRDRRQRGNPEPGQGRDSAEGGTRHRHCRRLKGKRSIQGRAVYLPLISPVPGKGPGPSVQLCLRLHLPARIPSLGFAEILITCSRLISCSCQHRQHLPFCPSVLPGASIPTCPHSCSLPLSAFPTPGSLTLMKRRTLRS